MKLFAFLLALCVTAMNGVAQTATNRVVPVSNQGALEITMPPDWFFAQTNQLNKPSTVRIQAPGNRLAIEMTVFWDGFGTNRTKLAETDFERIITNVFYGQYAPVSVEKKPVLEKLKGPGVSGLFMRLTDVRWFAQQKPPGEFNNLASGMFRCANLWGQFDLVTNDKNGPDSKEGLQVLQSLHRKSSL